MKMSNWLTKIPLKYFNVKENAPKKKFNLGDLNYFTILILTYAALILFFEILTGGKLLIPNNFIFLFQNNVATIVIVVGLSVLMVAGCVDLSISSFISLIGAIGAILLTEYSLNFLLVILICIFIGMIAGAWSGFWVGFFRLPPYAVTLGNVLLFEGIENLFMHDSLAVSNEHFRTIARGFLPNFLGYINNADVLTIVLGLSAAIIFLLYEIKLFKKRTTLQLNESKILFSLRACIFLSLILTSTFLAALSGDDFSGGIPISLLITFIMVFLLSFILNNTQFGRHVFAVGGNVKAAELSGINVKKIKFITFILSGAVFAAAAVLVLSRTSYASSDAWHANYTLDALAACYLGGAAGNTKGKAIATIVGAVLGALILGALNQGLALMGLSTQITLIIKGLIFIFAFLFPKLSGN